VQKKDKHAVCRLVAVETHWETLCDAMGRIIRVEAVLLMGFWGEGRGRLSERGQADTRPDDGP